MTVLVIAHRLQTILTAENLFYINSPDEVLAAEKGTPEYDELIKKLMETNYAHQIDKESDLDQDDQGDQDENERGDLDKV